MTRFAWYKRYPADFRDGTRKLSFEERGFYNDVLDLLYERAGDVPDDDDGNAHLLHCGKRTFARLKARLIELGKLELRDGFVRNGRAAVELSALFHLLDQRTTAGRHSAESRKSGKVPKDYNGQGGTGDPTLVLTGVPTESESESESEQRESPPTPRKRGDARAHAHDGFAGRRRNREPRLSPGDEVDIARAYLISKGYH
jgi:uncharacterized protein YdaU (DUF1376 family)